MWQLWKGLKDVSEAGSLHLLCKAKVLQEFRVTKFLPLALLRLLLLKIAVGDAEDQPWLQELG